MVDIAVSGVYESSLGWVVRLEKNWEWSDEEMAWYRLVKILKRHRDPDARLWHRIGNQSHSHELPLGHDRQEAELRKAALVGDLEAANFSVKEEKKMGGRSPYREGFELIQKMVTEVMQESRDDYVVRGGSEILVRGVEDSPKSWRWEYFPKVMYFQKHELVKKPRGPMDLQNYVFKRDGMLYAVDARRLYAQPD